MKKILLGLCALSCLAGGAVARAAEPADPEPEGADTPAETPAPPPRTPKGELGFLLVPLGTAYTRSAVGASFRYEVPLIDRPGILWNNTNVALGVRETYSYVNNTLAPFVEITPIAFFKLQASASYDMLIPDPFKGGLRVLTPLGEERLAAGQVERGNPDAVDWVEGKDNLEVFTAPAFAHGLRARIQPTLQAKLGPVGMQYNFTADWNWYRGGGFGGDAIFHDSFTFTLRKMRDLGMSHELVVVFEVPGIRDTIRIGAVGKHYRPVSTGLERLEAVALLYYRPGRAWVGETGTPWFTGQFGTNLVDPMHQYDFSWILALGIDFRLL